jgi:hypothetical protein
MIVKKVGFKLFVCFAIVNITIVSLFFAINGYCASAEIDSKFGDSPVIDGYIDLSEGEWNKASKVGLSLEGLPIDFWVMQNDDNLYISIQLELESVARKETEFFALIISNSSSENQEDFVDAKIVQFSNITEDQFDFFDYKVNNSVFLNDTVYHGNGAAKLEGLVSTYEFSIPISGTDEDASLDFGNSYAFNVTYGDIPDYPGGIKKSAIVLINIKAISEVPPPLTEVVLFILSIVIFSSMGVLLGIYIYKIFKLKEKIERYKR